MNDTYDPNQAQPAPAPPPAPQAAGFCQHCGKPLTTETIRRVGPAVYCEPCLAARLGAVPPMPGSGYRPVNTGAPVYGSDAWATAKLTTPGPNPGLAALLGLIPGVGAMYNEQYAKGIVHLIVFAVLISLADNVNGIFGLFCFGWICYMAIEAHHTARARRDGTPLPNPFGLNDIGERLGFGKAWPAGPTVADVATDAAAAAATAARQTAAGFNPPPVAPPVPPAASWGAPTDAYTQHPYSQAQYTQPFVEAAYAKAYADAGFAPQPVNPIGQPYTPVQPAPGPYAPIPAFDPALIPPASRFPAGAVWLIGLGTIFLLTTTGIFNGFPAEALVGCVLFGIGAWIFLRRMMDSGYGIANDGSSAYAFRILRALRVSSWLCLIGALFLLAAFNILPWRHSWPFLIILPGILAILERAVYQTSTPLYMPPPPLAPANGSPAQADSESTKGAL